MCLENELRLYSVNTFLQRVFLYECLHIALAKRPGDTVAVCWRMRYLVCQMPTLPNRYSIEAMENDYV